MIASISLFIGIVTLATTSKLPFKVKNMGVRLDSLEATSKRDYTDFSKRELTPSNLIEFICLLEIKEPLIVFYQAMYETGWFKCKSCSFDYNNLFGFGWNGSTYSKYNHWTESVMAYKVWQDKHYKGGDYFVFLNCLYIKSDGTCQSYAESPTYVKQIKSLMR